VEAANDSIPANVFVDPRNQPAMEKIAEDVFAGIQLANLALIGDGARPLYCRVGGLVLTGSQIIELEREVLRQQPGWAPLPWGMSFIFGLKWKFPCPPQT
jgi:hypothetical protein